MSYDDKCYGRLCFQTSARVLIPSFNTCSSRKHMWACKRTEQSYGFEMNPRAQVPIPALMFVTPDGFLRQIARVVSTSKAVLKGGATFIQIRDIKCEPHETHVVISELISSGIPPEKLVINGMRPDEVLSIHPALGIHIKQNDIANYLSIVKSKMPASVVGCAVHNLTTAKQALTIFRPSYLQIGTMFATQSHPGKILEGPSLLGKVRKVVGKGTALIGVGGVTDKNASVLMQNGADGVAVVRFLAAAPDPTEATAALMNILKDHSKTTR